MSLVRRKLRSKRVPDGFDRIEDVLNDFEHQLRDAVNEEHEGKRRAELTWKVHRLHWEKNRFIHDLMYVKNGMSRELFDFLVSNKVADGALIAKWRKPGYELLCSTLAIQKSGTAFGTTALCRVPLKSRAPQQREQPSVLTGCISCASGDGRFGGPIWWNTPMEEEGGGAGGAAGGSGGDGAGGASVAAAAEHHRATWAPVVPPPEEEQGGRQQWEEKREEREREEEGGEGGAAAAAAAETRKRTREEDEDGGEGAAAADEGPRRQKSSRAEGEEEEEEEGAKGRGDGGDEDDGGSEDEDDDEEDMPAEVKARLAALRGEG
jgi:bud site selection protein 31